jgi:hypothetical protein
MSYYEVKLTGKVYIEDASDEDEAARKAIWLVDDTLEDIKVELVVRIADDAEDSNQ